MFPTTSLVMKTSILNRIALAAVLFVVSLLALPIAGAATVALVAASLNYGPIPGLLGTSYPVLNVTTAANQVTDTAKAREELWARRVLMGSRELYQDAPLSEGGFMGREVPGQQANPAIVKKAIVEIVDTQQVAGNTVNIPTMAGFGGPGVSGESTRDGNEQKVHVGSFPIVIGRYWYGIAYTAVARDETYLGGKYDKAINDGLRRLHAKKRNDDHLMRLRQAVATSPGTNNIIYPEGITSAATLKTANTLDTTLITNMGEYLPSLGGMPMDTTDDSGGSVGELFTVFSSDRALSPLLNEPAYLQGLQNADVRGDSNRLFKGGFKNWNGHGIYRWINRDHANKGPMGSPILPRARLGYALSGANTNSIVHGGGTVCGATVDNSNADATNTGDTTDGVAPVWFEFFSNAPYTFYNGQTIVADTSTDRYMLIINNDGTGYACYNYRVNNGKAIIIRGRVSIGVGTETNTHPIGSLIVECNVLGVPIGNTLMLGASALVCGSGRIDGTAVNPQMGRRTEQIRNHGMDIAVGCEGVWGNAAVKRAGDSAFPNFLYAITAVPVPGAPLIS